VLSCVATPTAGNFWTSVTSALKRRQKITSAPAQSRQFCSARWCAPTVVVSIKMWCSLDHNTVPRWHVSNNSLVNPFTTIIPLVKPDAIPLHPTSLCDAQPCAAWYVQCTAAVAHVTDLTLPNRNLCICDINRINLCAVLKDVLATSTGTKQAQQLCGYTR